MRFSNLKNLQNRHAERGNVIFMVLVAVILFAALSFAVSDMMRGSNPEQLQDEKANLQADAILGYARIMRTAVKDMRINGCTDLDISFETPLLADTEEKDAPITYEHNPPAKDICKLFGVKGGGVNYAPPSHEWLADLDGFDPTYGQWYFPADVCIPGVGTSPEKGCDSDSVDNEDIIAILPHVSKAVCRAILRRLEEDDTNIPKEDGNAWTVERDPFIGKQNEGVVLDQDYKRFGCFEGNSSTSFPPSGTYHFFQVLLAR